MTISFYTDTIILGDRTRYSTSTKTTAIISEFIQNDTNVKLVFASRYDDDYFAVLHNGIEITPLDSMTNETVNITDRHINAIFDINGGKKKFTMQHCSRELAMTIVNEFYPKCIGMFNLIAKKKFESKDINNDDLSI